MRYSLVIFSSIFLIFTTNVMAASISTEDAVNERTLGNINAPITIIEYSSLTCPHCASFHKDTLPELKKKYIDNGKVKLIFRVFPFDAVSARAAMVARCVEPKRYFKFLDALFKTQSQWIGNNEQSSMQGLASMAKMAGMGEEDFNACVTNEAILDGILKRRLEGAKKFEIRATPSFIINDEKIEGAMPIEDFDNILTKYLK